MKKFFGAVLVGFCAIGLIFGGFFWVGEHFLSKVFIRESQTAEEREDKEECMRQGKITVARRVNADDLQIKKLHADLKTEKYEKRTRYDTLCKKLKESMRDMKIWYYAEDSEDLTEIELYLEAYCSCEKRLLEEIKEIENNLAKVRDEIKRLDEILADLRKQEVSFAEQADRFVQERDALRRRISSTEQEYKVTPVYRQSSVKKRLANLRKLMEKELKVGENLEDRIRQNEFAIEKYSSARIFTLEDRDVAESKLLECRKELLICQDAVSYARDILENARKILEINRRILEIETARDDKKVELYF